MPAISSTSSTILVTGANGFIATHIVGELLKKGYTVRATVRTEAKGKNLKDNFGSYGDKLQIFATGDIREDGAFDAAVQDVDGIIHAASPVHVPDDMKSTDPKELIDPAVGGALGILKSALKAGNLKRLVFISSCIAIKMFSLEPVTVDETVWNDAPVTECEEKGVDADGLSKYAASKTLAERATWDFYNRHKSEIKWDLVVINPPWVFGPSIHDVTDFASAPPSTKMLYGALVKEDFGGYPPLYAPGHGFTDCRDVATALVKAIETPEASEERIMVVAHSWVWQDFVDAANKLSPNPYKGTLGKGTPGQAVRNITFDTSKEKKILGMKYRSIDELTKDMLTEFQTHGF